MNKSISLLSLIVLLIAHAAASETYQEPADFIDAHKGVGSMDPTPLSLVDCVMPAHFPGVNS
jgi:hypothetical protein